MTNTILVFQEDNENRYFDASTRELEMAAHLQIMRERMQCQGWYEEEDDISQETFALMHRILALPVSEALTDYLIEIERLAYSRIEYEYESFHIRSLTQAPTS